MFPDSFQPGWANLAGPVLLGRLRARPTDQCTDQCTERWPSTRHHSVRRHDRHDTPRPTRQDRHDTKRHDTTDTTRHDTTDTTRHPKGDRHDTTRPTRHLKGDRPTRHDCQHQDPDAPVSEAPGSEAPGSGPPGYPYMDIHARISMHGMTRPTRHGTTPHVGRHDRPTRHDTYSKSKESSAISVLSKWLWCVWEQLLIDPERDLDA